ncbi:MAG TPA: DnaB-like helicase C-terminal domain-containing protein [Nocardioidaceae bacterium]|jgi:replicative DNA helicase|nr:DnaB-like helicase C-terminal domain-containing protein [Nocardioidaceae bacterium]
MDTSLHSLEEVLERADGRLRAGDNAGRQVWPTGFDILDKHLDGGFRSGDLVLLGGPQGLGKTTWALQTARNMARSGRSVVFFSYEHDPESLLVRLVALEAGLVGGVEAPGLNRVRAAFESTDGGASLAERLQGTVGGAKAVGVVAEYASRIILHRSTGSKTTLEVVRDVVADVQERTGQPPLVVVDYLQKVRSLDPRRSEEEQIALVVEGLKDLALERDVPILAVVAADKPTPESGKRVRVSNLRGSSALAYEADTVLILNSKYDVVARHHLVYDLGNAERFRRWAVLSIEKNRSGRDGVELEFQKRFEHSLFAPEGQLVTEQLVDERVFVE